jgi:hypothetical protein
MFNVSLYGHLTMDRIFNGFKKDTSVGSIGNVWKCLSVENSSLRINISPTDIGESLIMINESKCERASVANLNICTQAPEIVKSEWHHIMYLNELSDFSFIKDIDTGIVSADTCRGKKLQDLDILSSIDFLFISDEDHPDNINDIISKVRQGVILHSSCGSEYYSKNCTTFKTTVDIIENVNVLGCGDMFAAHFINQKLSGCETKDSIINSHNKLTEYLTIEKLRGK